MENIEEFKSSINNMIDFLDNVGSGLFFDQMNYLQELLDLIENKQYNPFFEKINSAELWGGSGSVWESEYGMTAQQRIVFENILLQLLLSMRKEGIMKQRARRIFKMLSKTTH